MGWAAHYIEKLSKGETVSFRPRGHSMKGKVESGQLCTVEPVAAAQLKTGDIVFARSKAASICISSKPSKANSFKSAIIAAASTAGFQPNPFLENVPKSNE